MSPNAGVGVGGGCGVSANEYSCAHGAQINLGFGFYNSVRIFGPGSAEFGEVPDPT
jgi:hypothetical protein